MLSHYLSSQNQSDLFGLKCYDKGHNYHEKYCVDTKSLISIFMMGWNRNKKNIRVMTLHEMVWTQRDITFHERTCASYKYRGYGPQL